MHYGYVDFRLLRGDHGGGELVRTTHIGYSHKFLTYVLYVQQRWDVSKGHQNYAYLFCGGAVLAYRVKIRFNGKLALLFPALGLIGQVGQVL